MCVCAHVCVHVCGHVFFFVELCACVCESEHETKGKGEQIKAVISSLRRQAPRDESRLDSARM